MLPTSGCPRCILWLELVEAMTFVQDDDQFIGLVVAAHKALHTGWTHTR